MNRVVRLLAYGDSITAGYYAGGFKFHPYADKLQELIGARGEVNHVGLSGWTSEEMRKSLDEDEIGARHLVRAASTAGKPYTHVLIMAGINDVSRDYSEEILKNLRNIHTSLHSEGVKSIALTLLETEFEINSSSIQETREEVNIGLKQFVEEMQTQHGESSPISLIDTETLLPLKSLEPGPERDEIWDDGLHLTPRGSDRLAEVIYKALLDQHIL